MARNFNGSTQYGTATKAFTGNAFTFGCWLHLDTIATWGGIICSRNAGVGEQGISSGGDGTTIIYSWNNTEDEYLGTSILAPVNIWFLTALVIAPTAATLYVGRIGESLQSVTNTKTHDSKNPSLWEFMNDTVLPFRFSDGRMADAFMYNASLSPGDIASLFAWNRPTSVRRNDLIAYWPIDGTVSPEPEIVSGASMTLVASPVQANHPSLSRPSAGRSGAVNIR